MSRFQLREHQRQQTRDFVAGPEVASLFQSAASLVGRVAQQRSRPNRENLIRPSQCADNFIGPKM